MNANHNQPRESLSQLILWSGIVLVLLGLAAIAIAISLPWLVGTLLACCFLVTGGVRLVYSWRTRSSPGFWLKLSTGVLALAASIVMFTAILERYFSLSTLLGGVLLLQGIVELILVTKLQRPQMRRLFLAAGTGALILGGLLLLNMKLSIVWLMGLVVALSLILPGGWLIFVALNLAPNSLSESRSRPK